MHALPTHVTAMIATKERERKKKERKHNEKLNKIYQKPSKIKKKKGADQTLTFERRVEEEEQQQQQKKKPQSFPATIETAATH